jgi:hypothetical protein
MEWFFSSKGIHKLACSWYVGNFAAANGVAIQASKPPMVVANPATGVAMSYNRRTQRLKQVRLVSRYLTRTTEQYRPVDRS